MSTRPRIRSVKPEAWQDERLGNVSRDARLLFIVLVTLADDCGRFRNLPALILGHGFPYDADAPRKLGSWMDELAGIGLVHIYTDGATSYGWLPGWEKHQRINRPNPSLLPEPSLNGHGAVHE